MVVSLGKMSHYYGMCQRASHSFHKRHLQNKYYKSNVVKRYSVHLRDFTAPTLLLISSPWGDFRGTISISV